MINESSHWKNDLLKQAKVLGRYKQQTRWPEVSFAKLEKSNMLGFYVIRKLKEAAKLSDAIANQQILVIAYPPFGCSCGGSA